MKSVLLDTHSFLWYVEDSPRLSAHANRGITEAEIVYLSLVSIWELSIKIGAGKLSLALPLEEYVERHVRALSLELLPIDIVVVR